MSETPERTDPEMGRFLTYEEIKGIISMQDTREAIFEKFTKNRPANFNETLQVLREMQAELANHPNQREQDKWITVVENLYDLSRGIDPEALRTEAPFRERFQNWEDDDFEALLEALSV